MLAPWRKLLSSVATIRPHTKPGIPNGKTSIPSGVPHGKKHAAKHKQPVFVSGEYLDACDEVPSELTQKLLVIEPHRTLVFPECFNFATLQASPYLQRPYLSTFRQYLVHPATRAWLHAVICTAEQATIAQRMIEECPPLEMDDFNALYTPRELNPRIRPSKLPSSALTPKNLDVLWSSYTPRPSVVPPPPRHGPATTIFVDRRERGAGQQPHNLLLFPEYDTPLRRHDLDLLHAAIGTRFSEKELFNAENRAREMARVRYPAYPTMIRNRIAKDGYEDALIALIGVLQHLKSVPNVAAWLRDGGLEGAEPTPGTIAPRPSAVPWFDRPAVFDMWLKRGYAVAADMGLELNPGIVNDKEHMVQVARQELDRLEARPIKMKKDDVGQREAQKKHMKRLRQRDQALAVLRMLTGNHFLT